MLSSLIHSLRSILILGLLGLVALCPQAAAAKAAPASREGASVLRGFARVAGLERHPGRVESFVDSVGVNTHLTYLDTSYREYDRILAALQDLGVRHVRDGIEPGNPDQRDFLARLGSKGFRLQLILGRPRPDRLEEYLGAASEPNLLRAVEALEGPNEYDLSGDPDWAARLRGYQQRLFERVKTDSRLDGVRVVGPSLSQIASRESFGSVARFLDTGNIHPYAGGDPTNLGHLAYEASLAARQSGSKPIQATELGYHNAVATTATHLTASEQAAAVYLPPALLDHFAFGIERSFVYELVDQRPDLDRSNHEDSLGLLRADFTRKPVFTAVRNLLRVLQPRSSGGRATPTRALRFRGGGPELRRVLLRRGSDVFLAVWRDVRVWDRFKRVPLAAESRRLTVRLGPRARGVEVYRPGLSDRPRVACGSTRRLRLRVRADVTVVRLLGGKRPARGAKPRACR